MGRSTLGGLPALAACLALLASGCMEGASGGAGKGSASSRPGAGAAGAAGSTSTRIHFDLGGAPSPAPLVAGSAGGRRTAMIVDTGAETHVLTEWLALAAHLPTRAAVETGHDALGAAVTFSVVDRPALALEGWGPIAERPVAVTRVPRFFEELGVGVILSPQLLATASAAVLADFGRLRLERVAWEAGARLLAERGPALVVSGQRVCSDPRTAVDNLAYVLPGAAEGHAVAFEVDTGARVTTVFEGTPAATALAAKAVEAPDAARGIGSTAAAKVVKGARVRVGEVVRTVDVRISPGPRDPACPFEGLLGIDFLRPCALLLAPDRMAGACAAPPPPPAPAPAPPASAPAPPTSAPALGAK